MKRFYVGIDISKDWLDVAVLETDSKKIISEKRIDNNQKHIFKLINQLLKKGNADSYWFCFEHTGNYGLELMLCLDQKSLLYSVVPAQEIILSQGIKRGKNDRIDAIRIAQFAAIQNARLKPSKLPVKELLVIKQLLSVRRHLIKTRSSYKNSLKTHKIASKVSEDETAILICQKQIEQLNQEINQVERQIKDKINSNEEIHKNFELITSVKGIGLIVAAQIIVYTNNFTSFDNHRKFSCYSGIAPFENSSGQKVSNKKTSKFRNQIMKTLLMNAANSAVIYDPQMKKYYSRKINEGKATYSVLNAVACKLIARMFAVVKRQNPYVIIHN